MNAPIDIDLDKISITKSFDLDGNYIARNYWDVQDPVKQVVLMVGERCISGFSFGYVPPGFAHRKVCGGELVPGPWAWVTPNPIILASDGAGTQACLLESERQGLLVKADLGDQINIDGHLFRIDPAANRNIKLTLVS
jgi:hypothetical protein